MPKTKLLRKLKDKAPSIQVCRVSDLIQAGVDRQALMREFVRVNQTVWGSLTENAYIWTDEMLESQFSLCPEHLYCAFENGLMVGTASGFLTTEEGLRKNKSWLEKTAGGFFAHHAPSGDVGFGADLSVLPEASPQTSGRLMLAILLCGVLGHGLKALYLGSRIPGYHKHRDLDVKEYVFGKRKSGKPLDPELHFYLKDGFEIVDIIPEYMDDPKSLNYGVLIRWTNPLYRLTKSVPCLKWAIRRFGEGLLIWVPESPFRT